MLVWTEVLVLRGVCRCESGTARRDFFSRWLVVAHVCEGPPRANYY